MTTDDDEDLARFESYHRSGDVEARNEIVERYTALAKAFARRYQRRGVPLDDLEQVALVGLIGAVERFDPSVGVRFTTFAGRTIDGELKRHFRDRAWSVRVPRRYQDLGLAVRATMDALSKDLGRSPTIPELAGAVGADVDEVLAAMEANQAFRAESLDSPAGGQESTRTIADELPSIDVGPGTLDDRTVVAGLLAELPDRERRIVELRFFGEKSQREIADEVGMSQMHVSRLLRRALATLRTSVDRDVLDGA
ncbi:MAG: SigB/SigF/SigG family RNA polymerase sigma factor [Actinomycetota bacterium]